MSKLTLNAIVTRALMDEQFRQALLAGQVERAAAEFPLGEEERWVLKNARATTMEGFVAQVHDLMHQRRRAPQRVETIFPSSVYQMVGAA